MSINLFSQQKKGQVVVLTIFVVLVSLGMTLVLFFPVNQQVIRLRKLLNTFQALAYSESGLEISKILSKGSSQFVWNTTKIWYTDDISSRSEGPYTDSPCYYFADKIIFHPEGFFNRCLYGLYTTSTYFMDSVGRITVENYLSRNCADIDCLIGLSDVYHEKIISVGDYKNIQRVLEADYHSF